MLNQAVPVKPVPPPPPPKPPPPAYTNSWTLPWPLVYTAWEPISGWRTTADFDRFCETAKGAGVRTIVMQIGQYLDWQPDRVRGWGFHLALWGVAQTSDALALAQSKAEGYAPQIEGPGQFISALDNLEAGVGRGLSISTVTTLNGFGTFIERPDGSQSTAEVERLIRAGCTHALTECYLAEGDFTINKMMATTKLRGFPYCDPLLSLYHDVPVSAYQPELDQYIAQHGKHVGSYLAETMRPQDWLAFGAL
jgi:hypothetical protein